MEKTNFEQVKTLVEQWDEDWGCGPFEDCLPEEDELRLLNELTGREWDAEDVRYACFEYHSHNSLEETVYFLFHGDYPPITNVDLVFYRPKPGAVLNAEAVYEAYRLGKQMKALEPLPRTNIMEGLRSFPGFQEHHWNGFVSDVLCMDCLEQPDPWSDICFHVFWYGGKGNPQPDHLLCLSCRNMMEEQIQALTNLLAGFGIPLQYREEDHSY